MKWWAILLIFMVACASQVVDEPVEPVSKPVVSEVSSETPEPAPVKLPPAPVPLVAESEDVSPAPLENVEYEIDPYTELGCENLLSEEGFAQECGKSASDLVVTYKVGTKNCFVNVRDRANDRLTAGVTLNGYDSAETALGEFERRLKVYVVGADDSVGVRAYTLAKADRETVNFVRGKFIVEVGSDTRLCSKEGIMKVAQVVDSNLK